MSEYCEKCDGEIDHPCKLDDFIVCCSCYDDAIDHAEIERERLEEKGMGL